jgi:CelD/BcsL family acetyltransferase involved in cellulose biosynthesis
VDRSATDTVVRVFDSRCAPRAEEISSIASLAEEWDALADRAYAPPFLRPGWIQAWWRAFGNGQLEILVARRNQRLVGVAPLYRRYGTLRSMSNWHTPGFGFLSEDSDAEDALTKMTLARLHRRVTLSFLDANRSTFAKCQSAGEAAGCRVLARTLERSPYLEIEGDWECYHANLIRSFRRDLDRRLRRLNEEGRVSFEVLDGADRLDELLAEGFRVEAASWKGVRGTAVTARPETRQFYWDVAQWAASEGWLRLAFLRLDGCAIAFHYCLEERGVQYSLKGGYDPRFSKFSPGNLIIQFSLARAFSTGLHRYEFLGGDESYKLAWTNSCHSLALLHLFAPSAVGLFDWVALAYGRPLAKAARLTPIVLWLRR